MRVLASHCDRDYRLYVQDSADRPPGLHVSDLTKALLRREYASWFKDYPPDETIRQVRVFETGHIVERAWGDALAKHLPAFAKPEPRQVDGIWMSPDGFLGTAEGEWPWPDVPHVVPAIFECKGGNKSTNSPKDHAPQPFITHPKFYGWLWNVMAYCYGWECQHAYVISHHFQGNYKGRPPEPELWINLLSWTPEELSQHWAKLLEEADRQRHSQGDGAAT